MATGTKRAADDDGSGQGDKRPRTKKQWKVPRKQDSASGGPRSIQPGDSGIWATCNKGRERACVGELRDLFAEYAELLYKESNEAADAGEATVDRTNESLDDIENEINAEVAELRHPASSVQLFTPIRIDVQCVVFFKTVAPVEPVNFVKKICEDAMKNAHRKRTRYVKRLSPMTLMGRASSEGLESVAKTVLEPHFHRTPFQARKVRRFRLKNLDKVKLTEQLQFAIRPTLRNHNIITRDKAIQQVAQCVGSGHEVDLRNYDLLIVVEMFQNVCGVSVLDNSFERLRRYNLSEIFDPKPAADKTSIAETAAESKISATDDTPTQLGEFR